MYYNIRIKLSCQLYSTYEYNYASNKQNVLDVLDILRSLIFVFINTQIEYR